MIINGATAVYVSDCDQLKFSPADKYFSMNLATLDLWRKLSASQWRNYIFSNICAACSKT